MARIRGVAVLFTTSPRTKSLPGRRLPHRPRRARHIRLSSPFLDRILNISILTRPAAGGCRIDHVDEPQPVEALLDGFPHAIRETGLTLRSLILRTVPGTVETIRSGWRWVAYSLPEGKRVRNFAWI